MLYCFKCKEWEYKTHKCSIISLVPTSREMREIVDTLYYLQFEILSASCIVDNVDRTFEHIIQIEIEFRQKYDGTLLQDLPAGWKWCNIELQDSEIIVCSLRFLENYVWLGFETVTDRVMQIKDEFLSYLSTRDKNGLAAVMTLMYS